MKSLAHFQILPIRGASRRNEPYHHFQKYKLTSTNPQRHLWYCAIFLVIIFFLSQNVNHSLRPHISQHVEDVAIFHIDGNIPQGPIVAIKISAVPTFAFPIDYSRVTYQTSRNGLIYLKCDIVSRTLCSHANLIHRFTSTQSSSLYFVYPVYSNLLIAWALHRLIMTVHLVQFKNFLRRLIPILRLHTYLWYLRHSTAFIYYSIYTNPDNPVHPYLLVSNDVQFGPEYSSDNSGDGPEFYGRKNTMGVEKFSETVLHSSCAASDNQAGIVSDKLGSSGIEPLSGAFDEFNVISNLGKCFGAINLAEMCTPPAKTRSMTISQGGFVRKESAAIQKCSDRCVSQGKWFAPK